MPSSLLAWTMRTFTSTIQCLAQRRKGRKELCPPPARAVPHADFLRAWDALFNSAALIRRRMNS
jgi:hypothetical protein